MPVLLLGNIFLLLCNENILFNRVKNIVFVLLSQGYLIKEIEKNFSCVSKSYRNTCASLGELEIMWKHSHYVLVFPLIISRSPKLARVFL